MGQVLLVLAAIGVAIYAGIDCLRSDDAELRGLPKPLWLLVILAIPLLGGVLWIVLGRQPVQGSRRPRRTVAPDDDPDFLRSLDPPRSRDGERRHTDGGPGEEDDGEAPTPAA